VKALEAQKKKPKIMTSFVLSDPILFKLAGETWEGTIAASAGSLPTSDEPAVKLYREVLEKYGGGKLPVGNFTLAGFQYGMPFVEALNRAGKDLTREKVYEALNSFQNWSGPALHWVGGTLGAPLTFTDKQRLGNDKIYLIKAKGGQWEKLTEWLSATSS
jgi:branched-chain amino acid transport system substrate-binding protein